MDLLQAFVFYLHRHTLICGFDAEVDAFIHAPTLSFNEFKLVLESGLLTHPTS